MIGNDADGSSTIVIESKGRPSSSSYGLLYGGFALVLFFSGMVAGTVCSTSSARLGWRLPSTSFYGSANSTADPPHQEESLVQQQSLAAAQVQETAKSAKEPAAVLAAPPVKVQLARPREDLAVRGTRSPKQNIPSVEFRVGKTGNPEPGREGKQGTIAATATATACPSSSPTIDRLPCPPCSCRLTTSAAPRPPGAIDPKENWLNCDVNALSPCFEDIPPTAQGVQFQQTLERTYVWDDSSFLMNLRERPEFLAKRSRVVPSDTRTNIRTCNASGLLFFGDSHVQLRGLQMHRLFRQQIYAATDMEGGGRGGLGGFANRWPEMLAMLSEAACPNDILVVCVITTSYTSKSYRQLVDGVLEFAHARSLTVLLFPDDFWLEEDPRRCAEQGNVPTSCAKSKSDSTRVLSSITRFLTEPKYTSNPRLHIIHELAWTCPGQNCDIFVPKTRTVGYRDLHHRNFAFQRYLEPFLCSALFDRGLL